MSKDITIQADRISLVEKPTGYHVSSDLSIEIENVDEATVLDNFTVKEIADHFSDELVEYIKKENNLVEDEA